MSEPTPIELLGDARFPDRPDDFRAFEGACYPRAHHQRKDSRRFGTPEWSSAQAIR